MRFSFSTIPACLHILRFKQTSIVLAGLMLLTMTSSALAQGVEWTEKDLAKNVHRAEEAFEGGEMSRAYGLFAHLVSIATDRAFLHFRFGSICTHTTDRLDEAEEHLRWAMDLGVLNTEHAAEWNYYQGRLLHLRYNFEEAQEYYRLAIDEGKANEPWMNDAKLFFGQCNTDRPLEMKAINLSIESKLASHSDDFFRLFDMPIEDGRILNTPDALRSKTDVQKGYVSTMHWLPGRRYAFFASYGKRGDTGLDIYRVSVDGLGEYGEPERLPSPINTDFDDCSPICIAMDQNSGKPDELYFSSSRPESFGGHDIFQASGNLFDATLDESGQIKTSHMPMEINSTSDEWLYYASPRNPSQWLATNRNQDFEGKEVWEFHRQVESIEPVAIRFEIQGSVPSGALVVRQLGSDVDLFTLKADAAMPLDFIIQPGTDLALVWENSIGVAQWMDSLSIPSTGTSQIAMEPLVIGPLTNGEVGIVERPLTYVDEPSLAWSSKAMDTKQRSGTWLEYVNATLADALRNGNREPANIQRILLAQESEINGEYETGIKPIPNWVLEALSEIEVLDADKRPLTVSDMRSRALQLQNNMEMIQCWEAPGSNKWELQQAIKRYGEPALGVLSEETRGLVEISKNNVDQWKKWQNQITLSLIGKPTVSQDWLMIADYVGAQVNANESALLQIEGMHRRIEAHLVYDRWITEALPMVLPEFRKELLNYTSKNQSLKQSIQLAATSTSQNDDSLSQRWLLAQELLWYQLTDSIVDVQEYGVFNLPEMAAAQSWFIRSGGLMNEAKDANLPQEKLAKGQAAIGLAWESLSEGAAKRDIVTKETQMTDSEWWRRFGAENAEAATDYDKFEMFVSNNSPIVQQAEMYLEELDIMRTKSAKAGDYKASLANAIALRSNLESQMQALFGGTTVRQTLPVKSPLQSSSAKPSNALNGNPPVEKRLPISSAVETPKNKTTQPVDGASVTKPIATESAASKEAEARSLNSYTIQIGAFMKVPNHHPEWFNQSTRVTLANGISKYTIGSFVDYEAAQQMLKEIQKDIPDAFLKTNALHAQPQQSKSSNGTTAVVSLKKEGMAKYRANSTPSAIGKKQAFRLKICTLNAPVNPAQVARLLRLGNEVPLVTMQTDAATVYYSRSFTNLADAENALNICTKKGFSNTELQIVD